jgi:prephenate dehydrogenase
MRASVNDKAETSIVQISDFDAFVAVLAQPPRLVARGIPEADSANLRENAIGHRASRIGSTHKGFQSQLTRRHRRYQWVACVGTMPLVGTMEYDGALADVSIFTTDGKRKTNDFLRPMDQVWLKSRTNLSSTCDLEALCCCG